MPSIIKHITIITGLFATLHANGQSDFGAWTGLKINAPIVDQLDLGIEAQARFENNLSRTDEMFISPFLKFDYNKFIRIGTDYRYTRYAKDNSNGHRTTLDITFRNLVKLLVDKSRFDLNFRLRGTHEFNRYERNENYLRLKTRITYNIPNTKIEPEIGGELFFHFNDQLIYTFDEVHANHRVNKFRLRAGISYPIKKRQEIKLFYLYQNRIYGGRSDFILGASYTYTLKRIIKK